jgi:hypothetical protein
MLIAARNVVSPCPDKTFAGTAPRIVPADPHRVGGDEGKKETGVVYGPESSEG